MLSNPLDPKELVSLVVTVLGGALLAFALGARPSRIALADALGVAFERADGALRRWPAACIALLVVTALFGWSLLPG